VTEARTELLFDDFALRYVRGERPDVRDYLERAGAERDELGTLIDRFLQAVPAHEPSEEDVVLMQARLEGEPVLLVLRKRRKLSRAAVVDALVSALGIDVAKQAKVGRYYHELETDQLDPHRVDRKVWDALGEFLEANARTLAGVRLAPPPAPMTAYRRDAAQFQAKLEAFDADRVPADRAAAEPDEVDRLFTAGT
jgi:hypothetical protein